MKFRTKLIVGFSSILIILIIFALIVLRMFFNVNQAMHEIVNDNYVKVKLAENVRMNINSLNGEMNELLLTDRADLLSVKSDVIRDIERDLAANMDELERLFEAEPDAYKLVRELRPLHNAYIASTGEDLKLLKSGMKEAAIRWHNEDTDPILQELSDHIKSFNQLQEQARDRALERSTADYNFTVRLVSALVAATLLCGFAAAIWVFKSVVGSLGRIVEVMNQAARARQMEQLPRIEVRSKDEIARISHAYNVMAKALEEHAEYQKQSNLWLQEQNWHKSKIAELTAKYQGVETLVELAGIFITAVAPAIGASYGVFYLRTDPVGDGPPRLMKGGAYAADKRAVGEDGFAFGEGLAGQCAAENRKIMLNNPPEDYIRIGSGLGRASPGQIAILPVQYKGKVVAVVELATFHVFTRAHLQLLEELTDLLGVTINSVAGHMQIQQLLGESQIYTEQLQTQSEELQLQQEELKTLNEQLRDQIEASEKKSAELEQIRRMLEEKNEQVMLASGYKTEFLTNMSHELRTPLNSLLILSHLMASNPEGNLTTKQVEYAQTIYSSGKDLLGLINEVLDLSKIEAGKLEVMLDWVRLRDIADFARRQFQPLAEARGLQFQVSMDDELSDMIILTDEQRLQQILQNLLSNAFKFTEQGSVFVEMRMYDQDAGNGLMVGTRSDDTLAISVSDTGIGIPRNKQAVIFEAFRQADGTTSRKYGGTGLGLSICQKIAQLLGGHIRVESEEGAGSAFTLYIPIGKVRSELLSSPVQEAAAAADGDGAAVEEAAGLSDNDLAGKTVLLVDDDLRNIYALTTALEAHRIHVLFAENGQEALFLLSDDHAIDLVIMDIMMPRMDGYEAIREIRKMQRYAELPIIALTAKAMKYDREKCLEAGANDYISKPILLDQLLSLIRVWLYR